ncbi:hypothetical protein A5667_26255 [Mycolicibacterium fortuitum]|nr:hypothetical protein A5667_26255 [Mycolicibacterium fortuitum]
MQKRIFPEARIDALGKLVESRVFVRISDFRCDVVFVPESTFGMRLEVVVPLRILGFATVRSDHDRRLTCFCSRGQ